MKKKRAESTPLVPDYGDTRVGSVVIPTAGRDAGLVLAVIAGLDSDYVLIADGKTRRLASPKKKKMQHLSVITRLTEEETEKLRAGNVNDGFLRRVISGIDLEQLTQG